MSGTLFMRCAEYYHMLEETKGPGQGDLREGSIFSGAGIYKSIHYPIYCIYMIEDKDIRDGRVVIEKRVVQDFDCEDGYMVIVPFDAFERVLPTLVTHGHALDGARVRYGYNSQNDIDLIMRSEDAYSLINKHPHFSYQNEYRLVVYENLYMRSGPGFDRSDGCKYSLREPLTGIARKLAVRGLREVGEGYVVDIDDPNCYPRLGVTYS